VFRRHHIHFAWHLTVHTYRVLTWVVLIGGLLFALVMLGLRYYVLPDINRYRNWIEAGVTRAAGQRVTVALVSGSWDGYRPSLKLDGVVFFDRGNRPALGLGRVEAVLAWRSLLLGEVRLHSLVIERPDLTVRRDAAGVVTVAGFPVNTGGPESGFIDWLLAQEEIQIRSASLTWIDEARGAPPLTLDKVDFQLNSLFWRHRFGLRIALPAQMGSGIDVRGDLRRRPGSGMAGWRGKLYARCGYANLAAGKPWIDLPVAVDSGAADAEVWADVADGRVTRFTADLRIATLSARLGEGLPALELPGFQGRVGFARTDQGYELSGRRLSFVLGGGVAFGPTDIVFRRLPPGRSQLQATRLDLAPVAGLAHALPLDADLRARLAELAPHGRVEDLRLAWDRGASRPEQFEVEARFTGLATAGIGAWPAFSGLSGRLQSDRNGGKLEIDASAVGVNWPARMPGPVALDWIRGQAGWTFPNGRLLVQLQRLAFANADLAGSASGSYRALEAGPGSIDLKAVVSRLDAPSLPRYVPLVVGQRTRDWLSSAFEAGGAKDAKLRLLGNLADFPFDRPDKPGTFEIAAGLEGVRLRFARNWPTIDDIVGTLEVRGSRLEVNAAGSMLGVPLERTSAVIAQLSPHDSMLEINGGARGPTQDFLAFIDSSPVGGMIDGLTRGLRAQGAGRLAINLRIPLDHSRDTAVAGSYQFIDNRIDGSDLVPALAGVNATLNFTDAGAKVANATAVVYDMPMRFSAAAERGGALTVNATGRANMARLQRAIGSPWLAQAEGDTDWKLRVSTRNHVTDLALESDLVGITSKLPPPLAKSSAEALPLRVQRRSRAGEQTLQLALGQRLSAAFALAGSGKAAQVRRGAVHFGAGAKLPDGPGIAVTGAFERVDVDAWLDLYQAARGKDGGGAAALDVTLVDLKAKEVEAFGRVLHDVGVTFNWKNEFWDGTVASSEVAGDIDWIPGGRGRLVARLNRLHVPEPGAADSGNGGEPIAGRDLPAIDVTATSFQFAGMDLGALALKATPNGPAWQVERFDLENPDFKFAAQGAWQSVRGTARTHLGVKLNIADIGRFLRRFHRPEGIAGGSATVEGPLEWEGLPYRLDYPSMSGALRFDARRGRFVKLEPGIGRLLGVFSLQSLPRRVSLDFRDIFSEGFAFERINGNFAIGGGVIRTEDMKMIGSSARVSMKGDVDLVNETQALEVRVAPSISDSVALGTAILNPAVGLATFLVGKVLKDPLDQFVAFEYRVSGGWADPVVTKVPRHGGQPAPIGRR
jgi:uncharacterized protein (TIGR02099 family)